MRGNFLIGANLTNQNLTDADFVGESVDGADLTAWQTAFGAGGSATHTQGDADGDRDDDGADFLAWQRGLDATPTGVLTATVPEPSAMALLLAGLPITLRRLAKRGRPGVCPAHDYRCRRMESVLGDEHLIIPFGPDPELR